MSFCNSSAIARNSTISYRELLKQPEFGTQIVGGQSLLFETQVSPMCQSVSEGVSTVVNVVRGERLFWCLPVSLFLRILCSLEVQCRSML